ncbi:unnamed protein product, partial [marine sediment metagenome]
TTRDRQNAGNQFTLAHNTVENAFVPEGTLIEVTADVNDDGVNQWWFTIGAGPSGTVHGELKYAHTPGATTTGYWQEYNDETEEWDTTADEDHEFEVTDPLAKFRGRGRDDFAEPHDAGSLFTAEYNVLSGKWEIVDMQPHALALEGAIYDDDTLEADGVHVMFPSGAIIVDQDPAGNITFTNPHGHPDIDEDMLVYLVWDESIPGWTERQKDCP